MKHRNPFGMIEHAAGWNSRNRQQVRRWLPALVAGVIAWIAFVALGSTPVIRASGMAAAVVGMAMALRPMGPALALVGGLALAFSPSFWIQTGGAQSLDAGEVAATFLAASAAAAILMVLTRRPVMALATAFSVFAIIFLTAVGTPRSLRVTTVLAVWLIYLITDGALASNPRADEGQSTRIGPQHTFGPLLLLAVGIANDPLFMLFAPPVALNLFLTRVRLPVWTWGAFATMTIVGLRGILLTYVTPEWWGFPADQTPQIITHIPFLIGEAWREPQRWLKIIELIVGQFTAFGLVLGILGLARLSRWHPPVGVVTMTAYGCYLGFGLIYFGFDAPVLLLPLLMIQVYWMTYAMYTFTVWLRRSILASGTAANVGAAAAFALLPLFMLLRAVGAI
ncbi:MAG: hypothetical protein IPK19_35555 [Chloroflexi bacterium]|nr:hypothetical protein [Chloroflexota bacterium]